MRYALTLLLLIATPRAYADDGAQNPDGGAPRSMSAAAVSVPALPIVPPAAPVAVATPAASWWRSLLVAGVSVGGGGLLVVIKHFVPDANPCGAAASLTP